MNNDKISPFSAVNYFCFFVKKVRFLLNIPGKFGIIQTAIEMAEDGGPAAHEKPSRARKISLYVLIRSF